MLALALSTMSGALALVYEVLWMRRFTELFGASAPGVAAALSAVFLGMAVGSATLGRRAARSPRPLLAYGRIEIGVGAASLLVMLLLPAYEALYPSVLASGIAHPALLVGAKLVLSLIAVFPATLLMGASLPYLVEAGGARAGALYAANTAGACAGALAVPLWLLPAVGVSAALEAAALASALLGAGACLAAGEPRQPVEAPAKRAARDAPPALRLAWIAAGSGFAVMSLEVLYTRAFSQVQENSALSFALVVAAFLAALAAGAAVAARGWRSPGKFLGGSWIAAGALCQFVPPAFVLGTGGLGYLAVSGPGAAPGALAAVVLVTLVPPVLCAGLVFPLALEIAPDRIGALLAASAAGSVAGPVVATFVLLPAAGLWWSFILIGVAMIAAGEACVRAAAPGAPGSRRTGFLATLLVLALAVRAGDAPRVRVDREHGEQVLAIREGSHGIVAVMQNPVSRWMTLDNSYTLGGTSGAGDERQQGHLPLLLHPAPRRVAFLGLGTGITAGAAMLHPVEHVATVELIPEVPPLAREWFAEANLGLLADPRVEVRVDDARTFLATSPPLDVIVGDLVVPWRPGEATLFTREQFRCARAALAPGGLFCQWLPAYQMQREHLETICATFLDVFPGAQVWRGDFAADQPAIGLIGFRDDAPLDAAAVDRRAADLATRVDRVSPYLQDPAGVWLYLVGPLAAAGPFEGVPRSTLDRPRLELSALAAGSALIGRRLSAQLAPVQRAPVEGTSLRALTPQQRSWRAAGAALWDAAVMAGEGRRDEADAKARAVFATLPEGLSRAVLGGRSPTARPKNFSSRFEASSDFRPPSACSASGLNSERPISGRFPATHPTKKKYLSAVLQ